MDYPTYIMRKISKSIDVRATYGFKIYSKIHVQNSIAQLVGWWTYNSEILGSIPARSILEKILKLMLFLILRSLGFDPGWLLYILKMLAWWHSLTFSWNSLAFTKTAAARVWSLDFTWNELKTWKVYLVGAKIAGADTRFPFF